MPEHFSLGGIKNGWQAIASPVSSFLMEPVWSVRYVPFSESYVPNSVLQVQLIASQGVELPVGYNSNFCTLAYRATAANPRRRGAGYMISVDF